MGACDFKTKARGGNAQAAFRNAVTDAQYDHGHSGYTGTIAEKDRFVLLRPPDGVSATSWPGHVMAAYAGVPALEERGLTRPQAEVATKHFRTTDDKRGPAGCVALGDGVYLFFGWASS